jgi:hypothetical protein
MMRTASIFATLFWLVPSNVLAQVYPIPVEGSAGIGVVGERSPSQVSPTFVGALAWDYDEKWPAVLVVEGELGPISEVGPCQPWTSNIPDNCYDAHLLVGLRFRQTPHASSGVTRFAHALFGEYWNGSGTSDDQWFSSSHFAVQVGGGVEIRWPGSIQGVRISVDYRHVFAGDRARNQFRVLGAYVIGPRRFTRRSTG